ncbi:bacterioferritin-associated ferredoxin [Herbaspirillum seropedicae]
MTSMAELRKQLGVGTCCGKCHSCAKNVLRECLSSARQTQQGVRPVVFHPSLAAA